MATPEQVTHGESTVEGGYQKALGTVKYTRRFHVL